MGVRHVRFLALFSWVGLEPRWLAHGGLA
jgi:hypothetical protein